MRSEIKWQVTSSWCFILQLCTLFVCRFRYSLCRTLNLPDPCSHLWCGHVSAPLVCKTKKGPPLEGTECGVNHWCVGGYCVLVDHSRWGPLHHCHQYVTRFSMSKTPYLFLLVLHFNLKRMPAKCGHAIVNGVR